MRRLPILLALLILAGCASSPESTMQTPVGRPEDHYGNSTK